MSDARRAALHGAFTATGYVVRAHPLVGGRKHVLRVGAPHPDLDAALAAHGYTCWAFLTAWNPRAKPRPLHVNARRQRSLVALLDSRSLQHLSAVGVADDRGWAEESLFIPGLTHAEARRIGHLFDQEALLWGRVGGVAELVDCAVHPLG
jgi:hypothetical protein